MPTKVLLQCKRKKQFFHPNPRRLPSYRAKAEIVRRKENLSLPTTIEPYEIIPIVNVAWRESFGVVEKNRKAIRDRGWWPYNKNLLLHPKIRATMTEREPSHNIILPTHRKLNFIDMSNGSKPTLDAKFLPLVNTVKLDFSRGTAMRCLDKIVQSNDIMEARNRNRDNQERGKTLKEELESARAATAGVIVRAKEHRLGWTVFTHIQDNILKKEAEALATTEAKRRQDLEISHRVREVLALQLEPCKWSRKDLECVVKSVKMKDDGPMPKLKKDIWEMYQQLRTRSTLLMNYVPGNPQNDVLPPKHVDVVEELRLPDDEGNPTTDEELYFEMV